MPFLAFSQASLDLQPQLKIAASQKIARSQRFRSIENPATNCDNTASFDHVIMGTNE
jgi:hypothetical protein